MTDLNTVTIQKYTESGFIAVATVPSPVMTVVDYLSPRIIYHNKLKKLFCFYYRGTHQYGFLTIDETGKKSAANDLALGVTFCTPTPVIHEGKLCIIQKAATGSASSFALWLFDETKQTFTKQPSIGDVKAIATQNISATSFKDKIHIVGCNVDTTSSPVYVTILNSGGTSTSSLIHNAAADFNFSLAATVVRDKLTVIYRGKDAHFHITQSPDGTTWSEPAPLNGLSTALTLDSGPAVMADKDALRVLYTVNGKQISTTNPTAGEWNPRSERVTNTGNRTSVTTPTPTADLATDTNTDTLYLAARSADTLQSAAAYKE